MPSKADEGRVAFPLLAILALGGALQVGLYLYGRGGEHDAAHLIRMSQWVILAFYGVVLALVVRMAGTVDFRPLWSTGSTAENVALGVLKGVAAAATIMLAVGGATGRIQVAPSVKFEMGDATLVSAALALLLLTVAAPVVEELLFRGLVTEAMRHRGELIALVAGGVLFALWHMRFGPVQLFYYTVLGVMLGRTYFKRGLVSSIAAHAGFNGTLAVVALVFILGPGTTMRGDGITVDAPGGWDRMELDDAQVAGAAFAAHGPSSAVFYVARIPIPAGITPEQAADAVQQNTPGLTETAAARVAEYPAGTAARLSVTMKGNRAEIALISTPTGWWMAVLEQSTERSRGDYEEMLQSLQLPA